MGGGSAPGDVAEMTGFMQMFYSDLQMCRAGWGKVGMRGECETEVTGLVHIETTSVMGFFIFAQISKLTPIIKKNSYHKLPPNETLSSF